MDKLVYKIYYLLRLLVIGIEFIFMLILYNLFKIKMQTTDSNIYCEVCGKKLETEIEKVGIPICNKCIKNPQ